MVAPVQSPAFIERVVRGVFWAVVAAAVTLVLAAEWLMLDHWRPWPVVVSVAHVAGVVVGLRWGAIQRRELREQVADAKRREAAYALADSRTDLDVIGPVTSGEHRVVHLFDQDTDGVVWP